MSSKQQEWAIAVLEAFDNAELNTNDEVAAAGGPSTTTVSKYRALAAGRIDSIPEPRNDVYRKIDRVALWEPGSARRLWRNGEPPVVVTPELAALYKAEASVTHISDTVAARMMAVVERKVAEVMRDAMRQASAIEDSDPEAADRIINDAMTVADMLRMTAQLAIEGNAGEVSEPADRTDDLIAAHEEEGSISGEQDEPTEP